MKEWELGLLQEWIYNKWSPGNSELIVVGRLDPKEAEASIRKYFDSWEYKGKGGYEIITSEEADGTKILAWEYQNDGTPMEIGYMPRPTVQPERSIFVFDKPTATQTQVDLSCQLATKDHFADRARAQVVGDVLSQMAWRKLREEAGVTYGAYAYAQIWQGGTGILGMSSLVQNDATGFAVQTMLDIVDAGSKGEVSEQGIADAKLSRAREYVLNQQSGGQMLNRLMSTGIESFNFFEQYGSDLAAVNKGDFNNLMATCKGHEVITLMGPLANTEAQLKEAGIEYTVVDWESERRALLTEKERKKEDKKKAKADKKKAKSE
jgi:predicted Zn-dependent peptidase